MKRILTWAVFTLFVFVMGVLLGAFYSGNFDFATWEENVKGTIITITIMLGFFSGIVIFVFGE